jgi:hypothetical protein
MASPVDADRRATEITSAADPWTIQVPTTVVAGDLLIMHTRIAGGATAAATPTDWTQLAADASDASDDQTYVFWRTAVDNSSFTLDLTASAKGANLVWRITGAENPATRAPEISAVAIGTGANPDPGTVTPTGGSKDYLFIAVCGLDGETQTFTAPGSYLNKIDAFSGTGGAAATNCRTSGAARQATASSENPGTFTALAPSNGWTAWTIAVHPPATREVLPQPCNHQNPGMMMGDDGWRLRDRIWLPNFQPVPSF